MKLTKKNKQNKTWRKIIDPYIDYYCMFNYFYIDMYKIWKNNIYLNLNYVR